MAHVTREARIQRDAVLAIQNVVGGVLYDWQFQDGKVRLGPGKKGILKVVPFWPKWLVDRIGVDYFGYVHHVAVNGRDRYSSKEIDQAMRHIGQLRRIESLSLADVPVTEAGLAHLERLTKLRRFILRGSVSLSDNGLAHMAHLTSLNRLAIDCPRISEAGLTRIGGLTELRSLYIKSPSVSDAVLPRLKGLTQLESLTLEDARVTDAGLEHLKGLRQLNTLLLFRTAVSESGAAALREALPRTRIERARPSRGRRGR